MGSGNWFRHAAANPSTGALGLRGLFPARLVAFSCAPAAVRTASPQLVPTAQIFFATGARDAAPGQFKNNLPTGEPVES